MHIPFFVLKQTFLLIFMRKWSKISIKVEESGEKWFEVVDKLITLWKSAQKITGNCLNR